MSVLSGSQIAGYLQVAYQQACQRLAELDTVPVDTRARFTHTTSQGITYTWDSYRDALLKEIRELGGGKDQPGLIQVANGPFEVCG